MRKFLAATTAVALASVPAQAASIDELISALQKLKDQYGAKSPDLDELGVAEIDGETIIVLRADGITTTIFPSTKQAASLVLNCPQYERRQATAYNKEKRYCDSGQDIADWDEYIYVVGVWVPWAQGQSNCSAIPCGLKSPPAPKLCDCDLFGTNFC